MPVVLLLVWASFGGLGFWIASQKRRPEAEGLVLGLIFGPLGCLIEGLMPTKSQEEADADFARRKDEVKRRYEALLPARTDSPPPLPVESPEDRVRRRQAERAAWNTEAAERLRRGTAERQAKAEADRKAWAEADRKARAEWNRFVGVVFKFGWFRALPDVLQPIVLGLAVAAPIVAVIVTALR